jgi:hypothetical protein
LKDLAFIYTYYNNPLMFKRQVEEWATYPDEIKERLKIYITDDCSDKKPLSDVLKFPDKIEGHGYYITKKVQWNWIAGRNIGANKADTKWLLLTDIDHVVTKESVIKIFDVLDTLDPSKFYFMTRVMADGSAKGNHTNSYLMTRELFWMIGGYDEDLSGLFFWTLCEYHRRAFGRVRNHPVLDITLTCFTNDEISDSNNISTFTRDKNRDRMLLARIKKNKQGNSIKVMSFPYIEL